MSGQQVQPCTSCPELPLGAKTAACDEATYNSASISITQQPQASSEPIFGSAKECQHVLSRTRTGQTVNNREVCTALVVGPDSAANLDVEITRETCCIANSGPGVRTARQRRSSFSAPHRTTLLSLYFWTTSRAMFACCCFYCSLHCALKLLVSGRLVSLPHINL